MVVLGLVTFIAIAAAFATLQERRDPPELTRALERAFPHADSIQRCVATLDEATRSVLAKSLRSHRPPRLWIYTEARQGDVVQGRAIEGDVIGKSLPITYLVLLTPENRVRGIEILNYRESHGGEVRREVWRAQFEGKSTGDDLQLAILAEKFPSVPRIALTATADEPTRNDIVARLSLEAVGVR